MKDQKDQDSHTPSQSDQITDVSRRDLLKLSGIAIGAAALGSVGEW